MLLDEPLSNLDAKLRMRTRIWLKRRLYSRLGVSTIYVTHDQQEALAMSDEIIVMDQGRIVQRGTPEDIYLNPATRFVADFIGNSNLMKGEVLNQNEDRIALIGCDITLTGDQTPATGTSVWISVRPEAILMEPGAVRQAVLIVSRPLFKASAISGPFTRSN